MLDYDGIKAMAKTIGRPVKDLLALSPTNDPFYAGVGHRRQAAEWFADMWNQYGGVGAHLRRIHYRLVSPPEGVQITLPNGREYQNTENDWTFLCTASLAARYLGFIPFNGLIDRRNDEPMLYASKIYIGRDIELTAECGFYDEEIDLDIPDLPDLPSLSVDGFRAVQDFIVEVWIEKSTQNDWLVPLCQSRGINLVVGIGEQSETRSRELAMRSADSAAPVRVIYLSDFDPGGRSMPKAVARKVEFTIAKFDLDIDIQIIPLALTPDQCLDYDLPRTPIKDTERRKDKFEQTFGVGATELDALEALHPGEMGRLLNAEIDNFIDAGLGRRVSEARWQHAFHLDKIEAGVKAKYTDRIEQVSARFEEIKADLEDWEADAGQLWADIAADLVTQRPDLSDVEIPRSDAPGETDRFVLFDSRRDFFTQLDHYHQWRDGDA